MLAEGFQNMTDERGGVTMEQLLVLFINRAYLAGAAPTASLFVSLRYAPASSKTGRWGNAIGGLAQHCPALLTTESVLLCFPRDSGERQG
jgi:hypothetical protein